MNCEEYQELIYNACYEELDDSTQKSLQRHLQTCPKCAAEKARVDKLFNLIDSQRTPQVDSEWLKSARNLLVARLESTNEKPAPIYIDWKKIARFMQAPALRVAYSAALLIFGIFLGRLQCSAPGSIIPSIEVSQMAVAPPEQDIESILQEGNLRNLDFKQLPDQQVQVSFQGTRDYQIMGAPQDQQIQQVLAYILLHEPNTGLRMRSLETLSQQQDSLVQQLLLYSLLNDENPGVRLKAVRSLHNYPQNEQTKNAYLRALMTDTNNAVRIEAMEGLKTFVEDEKVAEVLRIAAVKDSNDYVKLLAKKALENLDDKPRGTAIESLR